MFIFVLATLALFHSVSAQVSAPWLDLLVLDCNSKVHLLPSHPILHSSLDASIGTSVYSYVVQTIQERASCHCPNLTVAEKAQSFNADFGSVLKAFATGVDNSTSRDRCGFRYSVDQAGLLWQSPLPSTCSYDRWSRGLPCNLMMPIAPFNMNAQLSVSQCPAGSSSPFPFVSLTCSGQTCRDLMLPCSSDADCMGSTCSKMGNASTGSVNDALSSFFSVTGMLPLAQQNGSCPAASFGSVQLNAMMSAMRTLMSPYASSPSSTLELKFCGIQQFASADLYDFTSIPFQQPSRILSYLSSMVSNYRVSSMPFPFKRIFEAIPDSGPFKVLRSVALDTLFFATDLLKPVYTFISSQVTSNNSRVTWAGLAVWDGTLDNQQSVTSANRLSGAAFPALVTPTVVPLSSNPNAVPLVVTTCDMIVSVLPNQPISITARLPDFQSVLQAGMYRARSVANCRGKTSEDQFRTFFDVLSLEFWQNLLTFTPGMTGFKVPGLGYATSSSLLAAVLNNVTMSIPASCSLTTWLATGECSGSYTGLNSMFSSLDLTLNWSVNRCRAFPDALPSVNLQCVGQDCARFLSFNQIKSCAQDSDCGSGGQCNFVSNKLFGSVPSFLNDYWFTSQDMTCDSSDKDFLELMNYKNKFTKQPIQQFSNINNIGYCNMVWQQTVVTDLNAWANQSYMWANNSLTVVGLSDYVAPDAGSASSTGVPQPDDLPPNSKQVTFVADVPNSASALFAGYMLADVAAALALAYTWPVSAQQLLPYLEFAGMNITTSSPQSRRLLAMSTYSYYIYGTITDVLPDGPSADDLAQNFSRRVATSGLDTPNSFAHVAPQAVSVQDAGSKSNGAAAASVTQCAMFIAVLVAVLVM